ncbi:hypothetical protein JCM15519_16280 [Fundidesulfovibrio butyratiphilus]
MRTPTAQATIGPAARLLGLVCLLALLAASPAWAQQKSSSSKSAGSMTTTSDLRDGEPQTVIFNGKSKSKGKGKASVSEEIPVTSESLPNPTQVGAISAGNIKQPADFHECVRVALVQSPVLTKSALEIESRRLDVQDAWSTFIPTISLSTTYWFKQPPSTSSSTNNRPFTISFSTGSWNPFISGFDVKAKQEMVNIAVLAHLKVISTGILRLATDFLQLSILNEQRELTRKKQSLNKQNVEFFKTRMSLGHATQVEVQIAETKYQLAKAEEDKILSVRNMVMDDIKFILGIPFVSKLELDVKTAKQQILGNFTPADVTDDKVRNYSFELRMGEYEKSLQKKNIGLSYVKMLPSFNFTFQTVDALSNDQKRLEKGVPFYPGVSFTLPLDYWTKGREVARQYKKLDQLSATSRTKEYELMALVQKGMSEYLSATSDVNMAKAKAELTRLKDEQTEYRHRTGQTDFDTLVTDRSEYYDYLQKQYIFQLNRDTALLNLKHLCGDLQRQYIDVAAWEK